MASNQKKQENRPPLKFNFTYWEGFPDQFYEYIRYHYSTVSTPAPAAPLYQKRYLDLIRKGIVYRTYTDCIHVVNRVENTS